MISLQDYLSMNSPPINKALKVKVLRCSSIEKYKNAAGMETSMFTATVADDRGHSTVKCYSENHLPKFNTGSGVMIMNAINHKNPHSGYCENSCRSRSCTYSAWRHSVSTSPAKSSCHYIHWRHIANANNFADHCKRQTDKDFSCKIKGMVRALLQPSGKTSHFFSTIGGPTCQGKA